jgi:hypothetical protein
MKTTKPKDLSASEINAAENIWIRSIQNVSFPSEIEFYQARVKVRYRTAYVSLDCLSMNKSSLDAREGLTRQIYHERVKIRCCFLQNILLSI